MNDMFYPSLILLAVTASVLAGDDQCGRFFEDGIIMKCCKGKIPTPSPEFQAMYKECQSLPSGPGSCERETCISTKKGFMTPDGKLDISKIKEKMEKEVEVDPELYKAINEDCTEENLAKYTCPDWANDGPCEGLKDLSPICKKKYA
ncbi:hypothetical protein ABMA28_002315 [Loxostege sticticalis]|uniref:Uncharacterized protein n=1 Tax=Loxostege sticticalis TaxID=481309 RepID=A0ABD0T1S0_LOXSC